jgi:hypothetical protein
MRADRPVKAGCVGQPSGPLGEEEGGVVAGGTVAVSGYGVRQAA